MADSRYRLTEAEEFLINRGFIPPARNDSDYFLSDDTLKHFAVRNEYIRDYGFSIPNQEALNALAEGVPLIEIGAGAGYWAYELRKMGVDIVATDLPTGYSWGKAWTDIKVAPALQAVRAFPERSLLTIWPDYAENWAYEALCAYEGRKVFYIGEWYGCTGDDDLHAYLEEHFTRVREVELQQFYGIHDSLYCYERK